MSRRALLLAIAVLFSACAEPAPRRAAAPAHRTLTAAQRTANEREFYLAVTAYADGDFVEAKDRVDAILAVDPNNADARALRLRLMAVERSAAR